MRQTVMVAPSTSVRVTGSFSFRQQMPQVSYRMGPLCHVSRRIECNDPVTVRGVAGRRAAGERWRRYMRVNRLGMRMNGLGFLCEKQGTWRAGPTVRPMIPTNVSAKTRDILRSWKIFFALRPIAPTPLARRGCVQNMTPVNAAGPSNVVTITSPIRSAQLAIAARRQPLERRVRFAYRTTRRSTGGSTPRRIAYPKTTQR